MSIGVHTWEDSGGVAAPSSYLLPFLGTVQGNRVPTHGPLSVVDLPDIHGVMFSQGREKLRHMVAGVRYDTGLLAPSHTLTVSAGAKATATITATAQFATLDEIDLGIGSQRVTFKASLQGPGKPGSPALQVLLGADVQETLVHLASLVNGTGTPSIDVVDTYFFYNGQWTFPTLDSIVAGTPTQNSAGNWELVFTAVGYGTAGNGYDAKEVTDSTPNVFTIGTSDKFAGGADAAGTTPPIGVYKYAQSHYRNADGAESAITAGAEIDLVIGMNVSTGTITDSDDTLATFNRVYRTTKGGARYYKAVDQAVADATWTDSKEDSDLVAFGSQAYNERLYRSRRAGFPTPYRWLAYHQGRVWGYGALKSADYSIGTAAYTNGSATVTITTGVPTLAWIGREIQKDGDTEWYTIVSVNVAARSCFIGQDYTGTSNATASYTTADRRDSHELGYSVPLLPNQWPANQTINSITSGHGEGGTGLISIWDSLVAFTRTGIWRLIGDSPTTFQIRQVVDGIGCVNGRSIVAVGQVLYWMGNDGIYAWDGQSRPTRISNPPVQGGEPTGIQATIDTVNLEHRNWIHAHHDSEGNVLRWFVPLNDDATPRNAIGLDLQTGAFFEETAADYTTVVTVPRPDGSLATIAGDACGNVWHIDVGTADGVYVVGGLQTVTTPLSRLVITCTGSPAFPTTGNGLKGGTLTHKKAADGTYTRLKIASNTATALTLVYPMTTAPVAGDQLSLGGIEFGWKTGKFNLSIIDGELLLPKVHVGFSPIASGEAFLAASADQSAPAVLTQDSSTMDLTKTTGVEGMRTGKRGRLLQLECVGVEPGCRPAFTALELLLRVRGKQRVST